MTADDPTDGRTGPDPLARLRDLVANGRVAIMGRAGSASGGVAGHDPGRLRSSGSADVGLNRGGLLLPAAIRLWTVDRPARFAAFVVLPVIVVSPRLAAFVLVALAVAGAIRDRLTGHAMATAARVS